MLLSPTTQAQCSKTVLGFPLVSPSSGLWLAQGFCSFCLFVCFYSFHPYRKALPSTPHSLTCLCLEALGPQSRSGSRVHSTSYHASSIFFHGHGFLVCKMGFLGEACGACGGQKSLKAQPKSSSKEVGSIASASAPLISSKIEQGSCLEKCVLQPTKP